MFSLIVTSFILLFRDILCYNHNNILIEKVRIIFTLDSNLCHYARIVKEQLKKDITSTPGSGAAGGVNSGLLAFLSAELKCGIELVIEHTHLRERIHSIIGIFPEVCSLQEALISGAANLERACTNVTKILIKHHEK